VRSPPSSRSSRSRVAADRSPHDGAAPMAATAHPAPPRRSGGRRGSRRRRCRPLPVRPRPPACGDRWRPAARRGRRAWRASRRARRPPRQRATARPTAWRTPAATVAHGPAGDQGDQVPPAPAVGGEGEGGVQGAAGGGCRPAGWCPARCGGCRRPPAARAACGRTAPWSGTGSPSDRGGCRTRRAP
jgi:hypothetical protein